MQTDRIELFLQIVELGSVSGAAERLHMSQPAATRNLQALENELGIELFERRGRKLVLAPAGRAFLGRARAILADLQAARRELERVAERGYHDVRIGTVDSIGTYVMPQVLPRLRDDFPDLGLKLLTSRTAALLERIERDIDLAVVAWPGEPPVEHATRVARYDMQFYGREDRFPELAEVTEETELAAFPIVQIESKPGQPTLIDPDAKSFAMTQSLVSVKTLILGGFGVGAMLNYMLTSAERDQLVHAAIPHDPNCALWVIRRPEFDGDRPLAIEQTLCDAVSGRLSE